MLRLLFVNIATRKHLLADLHSFMQQVIRIQNIGQIIVTINMISQ
jgi:hypothetical protein